MRINLLESAASTFNGSVAEGMQIPFVTIFNLKVSSKDYSVSNPPSKTLKNNIPKGLTKPLQYLLFLIFHSLVSCRNQCYRVF